ncbi:hypothetical protein [Bradyrhizobium liaoningense]|uniref:hypothetical protein n=1 Tax=Bradyrhizobium liaoningense TaxID=43992 RepID=UPI0020111704|nr:hypothetical protein [Bradyrhizobium liaoningense]
MAPVIRVAVSQPLGRSQSNIGSRPDRFREAAHRRDVRSLGLPASLGLTGAPIGTLETGCEIDLHFINDATAEIRLNNYVYSRKMPQPAPPTSVHIGNKAKRLADDGNHGGGRDR